MNLVGNRLYPDKRLGVCFIHLANDNFFHFCWKDRKTGIIEDDILILPGLGRFSKVKCSTGLVFKLELKVLKIVKFYWIQYTKRSQNTVIEEKVNEFFNFHTLKFTNFTAEDLFMIYGMDPPENLSKSPIYLECAPNKELEDSDSIDSDESFMQMLEQVRKVFSYMEKQLSSEKFHVQFTEGSPPMLKLRKHYEADDEDTTTKKPKSTNKPKDGKTNSSKEKDKNSGNSKTENQKSNSKLDEQPKKKDDESKDSNSPTQNT
ncbi:Proteasomal ubiquitin receptor [Trichinella spiralis]|uniref:Proteasomal ubiquitin receptor n=1 Tax=Trichinella spiralis TaxID=6334 RepID=A0ABR3KJT5_TRISP